MEKNEFVYCAAGMRFHQKMLQNSDFICGMVKNFRRRYNLQVFKNDVGMITIKAYFKKGKNNEQY